MSERLAKKVLLIGWDAADWKMINPLLEKGWMPNLKKLMDNGVSGNLATIRPILSPMLWNSIASGKRADKHGICGFMEPNPDGTGVRPVTSTSRKCKALWNILSQNDMKSNVVGWFASDPAEPINGAVVSDRYQSMCKLKQSKRQIKPGLCHPPELADKLMELIVDPTLIDSDALTPFVPEAAKIDQSKDRRLVQLAMLISRMSTVQAAAHHLMMHGEPWDFTAIYFDAIDHFGHAFMPYHPPQMEGISDEDALIYKDVMNGVYRFQDLMLQSTLEVAGEDTTVIIVSDHGFHNDASRPSTKGMDDPEGWHSPFGMAVVSGPGIKQNDKLYGATLLDITPTILTLLGLPVGADMDGRPWLEILDKPVKAERILSWDSVEGESGMHTEDMREDPVAAAEAIKQLVELGYIEDPGDDAEKAVKIATRDLKHNLARALEDSKRAHMALPIWQELVDMGESENYFQLQLAKSHLHQGNFIAFERVLGETFTEEELQAPVFQMMLGDAKMSQGKTEEGLAIFEKIRETHPQSASIHQRLGSVYCVLKQWDKAEEALRQTLEEEKQNPTAYNGLAEVQIARGEFAQAVEYALQAVGLFHQYPPAHRTLGVALAGMGMDEQAIQAFETSLGMEPHHQLAHYWLAKLYRRDNRDVERAARHEAFITSRVGV